MRLHFCLDLVLLVYCRWCVLNFDSTPSSFSLSMEPSPARWFSLVGWILRFYMAQTEPFSQDSLHYL